MQASINTIVSALLKTVEAGQKVHATYMSQIDQARHALAGMERAAASDAITPTIGKHYKVAVSTGQRGMTFDKDAQGYEAAKRARTRILSDIFAGQSDDKAKDKAEIDPAIIAEIQNVLAAHGLSKAESKAACAAAIVAAFA